jgi:hypothetical protein
VGKEVQSRIIRPAWRLEVEIHTVDDRFAGEDSMREYRATDEEAATYLGGCLQIPARGLDWAFQHEMNAREIAEHFGASLQMVLYRCNMTGYRLPV